MNIIMNYGCLKAEVVTLKFKAKPSGIVISEAVCCASSEYVICEGGDNTTILFGALNGISFDSMVLEWRRFLLTPRITLGVSGSQVSSRWVSHDHRLPERCQMTRPRNI
ncbi:hypothetical protein TNCV_5032661 [Trichonephila clavipes]|nr:hypothetical protein TNCV_5032661 [Trichonephila clavipes]